MNGLRGLALTATQKIASIAMLLARVLFETFDLRDAFWVCGLSAIGYGVAQIHAPAAWIICGAAIFWMGVRR